MNRRPPNALDAIGSFFVAVFAVLLLSMAFMEIFPQSQVPLGLIVEGALLLIVLGYVHGARLDWTETFRLRRPRLWDLFRTVLVAVAMMWILTFFGVWQDDLFRAIGLDFSIQVETLNRDIQQVTDRGVIIWSLVLTVLPAVSEELLFRGVILGGLSRSFSPLRGAVYSSLLFAALHPPLPHVTGIFLLGLSFAMVALGTRSIFCAMFFHLLNNVAAVLMLQQGVTEVPLILLPVSLVVLALVGLSFYAES